MIHPRAVVDRATVGDGSKIWQFASVIRGAVLGERCIVGSCAIVDGAHLGAGCHIGHGASINPGVRAGKDVFIGPGAVICNDVWPSVAKDGWSLADVTAGTVVLLEDGASIGANAVLLPGVIVGKGAMVAAGATVTGNVAAGELWDRDGKTKKIPPGRTRMRFVG